MKGCRITKEAFRANLLLDKLQGYENFIILNIGCTSCSGDSYGPKLGTLLNRKELKNFKSFGSMKESINATNVIKKYNQIKKEYPNSKIICVDASISYDNKDKDIDYIIEIGGLFPGAGVNKELTKKPIGDYSIKFPVISDTYDNNEIYKILKNIPEKEVIHKSNKVNKLISNLDIELEENSDLYYYE